MPGAGYDIGVSAATSKAFTTPFQLDGATNFFFGNGDTATGAQQTSNPYVSADATATTKSPGATSVNSSGLAPNQLSPSGVASVTGLSPVVLYGGIAAFAILSLAVVYLALRK